MLNFDVYLLDKLDKKEVDQEDGMKLLKKYKNLSGQEAFKDKTLVYELLHELEALLKKNKNKKT